MYRTYKSRQQNPASEPGKEKATVLPVLSGLNRVPPRVGSKKRLFFKKGVNSGAAAGEKKRTYFFHSYLTATGGRGGTAWPSGSGSKKGGGLPSWCRRRGGRVHPCSLGAAATNAIKESGRSSFAERRKVKNSPHLPSKGGNALRRHYPTKGKCRGAWPQKYKRGKGKSKTPWGKTRRAPTGKGKEE